MWDFDIRLAGLISVIRIPGLARSDGGVVNKLKQVLSETGDNGNLLRVLAHGIELVCERSLELLAGDVGKLSLSDKGLGFGTHEFLLKNNNLGRVRLLVLQLGDLVGDLLLALETSASVTCARSEVTHDRDWAARTPQCCECS